MEKTKSDKLIAAIERLADVVDDLEETANFSTVALLTADEEKTFIAKFKKLDDNARIPERNGAGWDLFLPKDVTIQPGGNRQDTSGLCLQAAKGLQRVYPDALVHVGQMGNLPWQSAWTVGRRFWRKQRRVRSDLLSSELLQGLPDSHSRRNANRSVYYFQESAESEL